MSAHADVPIALVPHPDTPCRAVRRAGALLGAAHGGVLPTTFFLEGDIEALRIPGQRPPRRADGLWRHTCFELFAAGEGDPAYVEFNLSPSGEWAAYAFRAYREGGESAAAPAPGIEVSRAGARFALHAGIPLALLPAARPLRLGLSAVVEEADGPLSYWALRHPAGRPDFHHPDAFALTLARPGTSDPGHPAAGALR